MSSSNTPPGMRQQRALERRAAVIEAALLEFLAKGFAATRIEDIAKRAQVAKGSVYLYFSDKEVLFAEAVRSEIMPTARQVHAILDGHDSSPRAAIEQGLGILIERMTTTRAGDVLRLILGESLRFPHLTGFYREEVVRPALQKITLLLQRARDQGLLRLDAVSEFPILLMAPMLALVVAQGIAPRLAVEPTALLRTHLDLIFASPAD